MTKLSPHFALWVASLCYTLGPTRHILLVPGGDRSNHKAVDLPCVTALRKMTRLDPTASDSGPSLVSVFLRSLSLLRHWLQPSPSAPCSWQSGEAY